MKLKDFDFRVWSEKEGKYIHKERLTPFLLDGLHDDDLEIELFTGLCDKYHRKIYEGDILGFDVERECVNGRVFYNNNEAMFLVDCEGEAEWLYVVSLHTLKDKIKAGIAVVGDIHRPKHGLIRIKG